MAKEIFILRKPAAELPHPLVCRPELQEPMQSAVSAVGMPHLTRVLITISNSNLCLHSSSRRCTKLLGVLRFSRPRFLDSFSSLAQPVFGSLPCYYSNSTSHNQLRVTRSFSELCTTEGTFERHSWPSREGGCLW